MTLLEAAKAYLGSEGFPGHALAMEERRCRLNDLHQAIKDEEAKGDVPCPNCEALAKRVEELEAALEFSYTLACRGVERIDEENKTCGARLSLVHRKRLTIMCNQIKYHKDKWLRAEEKDNAVEVGG